MFIYPLLSVIIVSLISLVGVFALSIRENIIKRYTYILVSLAVGALLGDAFIHLVPEGIEKIPNTNMFSLAIIFGIILFFILEKYFHWHHHGEDEDVEHEIHPVGKMILVSDGFHNFIDGLIIGASFLVSVEVGIATTIAVLLHEIPQEIGDFAVLLHAGYTRVRALWLNFLSALTSVIGVLIVFALGQISEMLSIWLIPIAAGGFIYIAMSDLIPELHKKSESKSSIFLQIVMIAIGIASMFALLFLE